jgi:hypothetical protein
MSVTNMSDSYDSEKHVQISHNEHNFPEIPKNDPDSELQLDKHGMPLVPQPSRFKDDPLVCNLFVCGKWQSYLPPLEQNWPAWLKWAVLIQVSFMAFLGPFNAAVINPSLVLLSKAMHVDTTKAAFSTTTGIILGGVAVSVCSAAFSVQKLNRSYLVLHLDASHKCLWPQTYHAYCHYCHYRRRRWICRLA